MILFLDFDGVLHKFGAVHEKCFTQMTVVEKLMSQLPHVEIVLSTSWRVSHGIEACLEFFSKDLQARIIDVTPSRVANDDLPSQLWSFPREAECWYWMRHNRPAHTKWLAIDDEPWRFSPFCKQLYLTNGKTGFVDDDIAKIVERLRE